MDLLSKILSFLIYIYSFFLSPILGNNCRFIPSCSKYGLKAIHKFGFFGIYLIIKRILKCNPLFTGGIDPVPNNTLKRIYIMDAKYNVLLIILLLLTLIIIQIWQEEHISINKNLISNIQKDIDSHLFDFKIQENIESTDNYITVITDVLSLKINTRGGDIEEASLLTYYDDINSKNPFTILKKDRNYLYQVQSGIIGTDGLDNAFQDRPVFSTDKNIYVLKKDENELHVSLFYTNHKGIKYIKTFILRRGEFYIDVKFNIFNNSSNIMNVSLFGQLKQSINLPNNYKSSENEYFTFSNYRGTAYSTDFSKYKKYSFNEIKKSNLNISTYNGWIAMLQQYFAVAWIPKFHSYHNLFYTKHINNIAVIGFKSDTFKISPQCNKEIQASLWIGPEIQDKMSYLAPNLNLVVDYGYLWFISQPLFKLLQFINFYTNNWGVSVIIITLLVRIIMYPLTKAQYVSMLKMRILQPKILEIKERLHNDKHRQSQEIISLYKSENVNPFGGCLPVVIQMPIFLALYYMLSCSIELRHASFIFWINDLSSRDQYYILPIVMGITSFLIQKFSPSSYNNSNDSSLHKNIVNFIPLVFTLFFLWFPSGLVLYYIVNNIVTLLQQFFIYKKLSNSIIFKNNKI